MPKLGVAASGKSSFTKIYATKAHGDKQPHSPTPKLPAQGRKASRGNDFTFLSATEANET
jgi:hypothetical protein